MTRIQTRISHVHPTASIYQHGTLLRLGYCGVLHTSEQPAMLWRTRVPVTRTRIEATQGAMDGSCSDDSEIEEEQAGGGLGPSGGGREQGDCGT